MNSSDNPTLYLTRGIPGSGKSTFAKEWVNEKPNRVRINNDELRLELFNKRVSPEMEFSKEEESLLKQKRRSIIVDSIEKGFDVIVDNVNISNHLIRGYIELSKQLKCEIAVIDFSKVPLELCLERNESRGESKVRREDIIRLHETMTSNQEELESYGILFL